MTDVKITHLGGHDAVLMGSRARSDRYEVELDGRTYWARCGAVWDRPTNNGWRLESLLRQQQRRGSWRAYNAGQTTTINVRVGQNQKAWHVIEDALHAHRAEHGYGQRPAPKEETT